MSVAPTPNPRPDVTAAQVLAVSGWMVAQAVAFGLLDPRYEQVAISVGATVLAAAWKLADARIRAGRAMSPRGPVAFPLEPVGATQTAAATFPVGRTPPGTDT